MDNNDNNEKWTKFDNEQNSKKGQNCIKWTKIKM